MLQGQIVFDSAVYDIDGNSVIINALEIGPETLEGQTDKELVDSLPAAQRLAIMSFSIVIDNSNAFSFEEMHALLKKPDEMQLGAEITEQIYDLYAKKPPKLDTWRVYVNRAVKALQKSPTGREFVKSLGLPRN